jgi:hypothetical protein
MGYCDYEYAVAFGFGRPSRHTTERKDQMIAGYRIANFRWGLFFGIVIGVAVMYLVFSFNRYDVNLDGAIDVLDVQLVVNAYLGG